MAHPRETPDQRRGRYLRLAASGRERALTCSPERNPALLAIAAAWDKLARSVSELGAVKRTSQLTIYGRTQDMLLRNKGSCCCDACLADHVGARRANVSAATRRLGTEPGFSKYIASCDFCGDSRSVTRASPDSA